MGSYVRLSLGRGHVHAAGNQLSVCGAAHLFRQSAGQRKPGIYYRTHIAVYVELFFIVVKRRRLFEELQKGFEVELIDAVEQEVKAKFQRLGTLKEKLL
ncbi:MAG TPA: hypothetical protein VK074_14145 [Fodinibius sp.]|nr:hypothetical protein [Fodinibius sp.]